MIELRTNGSVVMWLNRGKCQVFYLCRRVNGRPRQFRVGTGPLADLLAAELESRKRARQAQAEACASRRAEVGAAENPLDALCASLDQVTSASLLAHGYHRHDRGPWRKKREHPEVQPD
jgi:hypothetical protein